MAAADTNNPGLADCTVLGANGFHLLSAARSSSVLVKIMFTVSMQTALQPSALPNPRS